MLMLIAFIRNKLFKTQFVFIEYSRSVYLRKVRKSTNDTSYALVGSSIVLLTSTNGKDDNLDRYPRWIWVYK